MSYIIRSMTTTDYTMHNPIVRPYHIFLLKREKRSGAFWSTSLRDAQTFATQEEAIEEINRYNLSSAQIVPADQPNQLPAYWDWRKEQTT